jgi:hypothetical protein
MKTLTIQEKLAELDVDVNDIPLGDFDLIGEYAAKRTRSPDSELYKRVGCFYRANYERGILISYLVKKYKLRSILELGFGRGYFSLCAAKAMNDAGIDGLITSIDSKFDEDHLKALNQVMPNECNRIKLIRGPSSLVVPTLNEKFDLIFIDGDHTAAGVRTDWENTKDKFTKFILFDDYNFVSTPQVACKDVIDEHVLGDKELIIMDRKIFFDDRSVMSGAPVTDGGQVLMRHPDFDASLDNGMW